MAEGLGKKKRGVSGVSNARAKPFRLNGGIISPPHMREIYRMAGLTKISPFIPTGQTNTLKKE